MARPLRSLASAGLAWGLLTLSMPSSVFAQTYEQQPPAHMSVAEGAVILERDGKTESSPASMPLLAGDRVRTQSGRAEILFADSSTLHLDAGTVVDFQSDEVIRLLDGRVRVNIPGPNRRVGYRIDAPSAWVEIGQPGEYRIALVGDSRGRELELAVLRGAAELVNEDGATRVRAGERAFAAAGSAPTQPYVFNSASWDAFDRWSEARRDQRLGVSAEYVPEEVQPYATTLATYGSWQYQPTYGYVWYPRVAVGWRPYYYGRWSHYKPWGWTWIGHDPWAWPTHHYGRWGFSGASWFWIPGKTWGAAWVSWAYAPGYVSWCPLGWNNAAVFGFHNYNVYRGHGYNRWHGWTVVPHARFGHGFVNVNVVNANRLDVRTRDAFAVRGSAPEFRGQAVPRAQAPIRVAGTRSAGIAVPRTGSQAVPEPGDRAAFRSRGAEGAPLNGPGFPAPAREPRTAMPRSAERSAPAAAPSQPGRAPSPSGRAVPQTNTEFQRAPAAPSRQAPVDVIRPAMPSAERMRAVPRRADTEPVPSNAPAYVIPRAQPSPQNNRYPGMSRPGDSRAYDPGVRRAPEQPQYSSPRAVPRGYDPPAAGAPSYRAPERSVGRPPAADRPSGPPPSAAPPQNYSAPGRSQPAPRSGGGSVGAPSRSGGQGSGGQAGSRSSGGQGGSRSSGGRGGSR
jgi:hypothetical protein